MGVSSQFHVIFSFFFDYLNWNNIHTTLSTSESLTNKIENTIRKLSDNLTLIVQMRS